MVHIQIFLIVPIKIFVATFPVPGTHPWSCVAFSCHVSLFFFFLKMILYIIFNFLESKTTVAFFFVILTFFKNMPLQLGLSDLFLWIQVIPFCQEHYMNGVSSSVHHIRRHTWCQFSLSLMVLTWMTWMTQKGTWEVSLLYACHFLLCNW